MSAVRDVDAREKGLAPQELLLDVTRLIWRASRGRHPTGIDRVCLAYLNHYRQKARAVVQRGGMHMVLDKAHSRQLFDLLENGVAPRWRLAWLLARAVASSVGRQAPPGALYLNVGHTGLDEPSLPAWVARRSLRAVYLIHDLIPLTHPQFCRPGEGAKHAQRMRNALLSARGIIGNSQASLAELERFCADQGLAMPASISAWLSGPQPRETQSDQPLQTPYFVTVGTIEGRKNHLLLLRVWSNLVATTGGEAPTLVIIGQRGWEAAPVFALLDSPEQYQGKVIELNGCDDDELAAWIGGARALLMPSFAEGFGLPIIEALQLGTPVIASPLPVFHEIAGSIPTFVDPAEPAAWAESVREFIADGPERMRQSALIEDYRAPDWAAHFAIVDRWLGTLD